MKLKNITLFRRRANWHAKEGHIRQGTYGGGKVNGKAIFHGCFVGCLATPHTKSKLTEFLRANLDGPGPFDSPGDETVLIETTINDQHKRLSREFGLTLPLIAVIEALFEAQPTHAEAIDFVPAVARAANAGADITPKSVREFWTVHFPDSGVVPAKRPPLEDDTNWAQLRTAIKNRNYPRTTRARNREVRKATEEFLTWLRTQKPVAV